MGNSRVPTIQTLGQAPGPRRATRRWGCQRCPVKQAAGASGWGTRVHLSRGPAARPELWAGQYQQELTSPRHRLSLSSVGYITSFLHSHHVIRVLLSLLFNPGECFRRTEAWKDGSLTGSQVLRSHSECEQCPAPGAQSSLSPGGSEGPTVPAQAAQGPGDPPLTTERKEERWGPSPSPGRVAVLLVGPLAPRNLCSQTPFSGPLGLKQNALDKRPLWRTARSPPPLALILEDVAVKEPPLLLARVLGWASRVLAPGP